MNNQANFEGATLELLRYLKDKKESIQARHNAELAEIDKQIESVSITVNLLRETKEQPMFESVQTIIPIDLHGKSTRQACIEIAKKNGGVVRIADAKDALISAGILKKTKNTWAIIYTTLHRSKEFEKVDGPGTFRLLPVAGSSENAQTRLLQ